MTLRDYMIKREFGRFISFKVGEVRRFTEEEARILNTNNPLVEVLEDKNINEMELKPNKSYKKGRRKNK